MDRDLKEVDLDYIINVLAKERPFTKIFCTNNDTNMIFESTARDLQEVALQPHDIDLFNYTYSMDEELLKPSDKSAVQEATICERVFNTKIQIFDGTDKDKLIKQTNKFMQGKNVIYIQHTMTPIIDNESDFVNFAYSVMIQYVEEEC